LVEESKATKDGQAPLYARVTIDGEDEEISVGKKLIHNFGIQRKNAPPKLALKQRKLI